MTSTIGVRWSMQEIRRDRPGRLRHFRGWLGAVGVMVLLLGCAHGTGAQTVTRGPYLQLGTPNSIVVRWRTDQTTNSQVSYGTELGTLSFSASSSPSTTEHEVTLPGLQPDKRYYYAVGYTVGTSFQPLAGGDNSYSFMTAPAPDTAKPTRIWVVGDSGTANANAAAVRNAYKTYTGAQGADLWLMLGDNAYPDGTDAQYQAAVFNMYPEQLRQMVLWPTLGNHDGHSADSATQSGPYYNIFTLPTGGQAGGVSSGTEAYYAFDYGNIHFVCLESYETSRSPTGAMLTWLAADLAATDKRWIIAFWHHPPYSKGSHDSDTNLELIEMRQNALPILEAHGVDLVLTGHSHSYERSFLLGGHYGASNTLTPAMLLDSGDGREDGQGAYTKAAVPTPKDGAVYAVAGSSGQTSGGPLNHPAMFVSLNSLGSMVLDVDGNRINAVFIDATGAVLDYFTLVKGQDTVPPVLVSAKASNQTTVLATFSERVELTSAETASNYSIDNVLSVSQATLQDDGKTVVLITSPLAEGTHTLTVNNVLDLAGHLVTPNPSSKTFTFESSIVIEVRVAASADDAEESASGSVSRTSSNLELVYNGSNQTVGLRFQKVAIPRGAIIKQAYVQFQASKTSSGTPSLTLRGQASDNASAFSTSKKNISARAKTTASVPWSPVAAWTVGAAGPEQRTLNIAPIMQEIVDRTGWSSGNALVLMLTGTGQRVAKSYDSSSTGAALLHVEYYKP